MRRLLQRDNIRKIYQTLPVIYLKLIKNMNQELYKSMAIFNGKLTDLVQHLNTKAIPNLSPPQKK